MRAPFTTGFTLLELVLRWPSSAAAGGMPLAVSRAPTNPPNTCTTVLRNLVTGEAAWLEALRTGTASPFVVDLGQRRFGIEEPDGRHAAGTADVLCWSPTMIANEGRGSIRSSRTAVHSGGIGVLRPRAATCGCVWIGCSAASRRKRQAEICDVARRVSLLEVLVAFSIMALALGALYQAAGGSVRGAAKPNA